MTEWKSEDTWLAADEETRKKLPPGVKLVCTLRGHTGQIGRIAWSPDGRMLASPSADQTIRLWNLESGKPLRILEGHAAPVVVAAFGLSGGILAAGCLGGSVNLWDSTDGTLLRSIRLPGNDFLGLAFDPGGRTLACTDFTGGVTLWDHTDGKLLRTLKHSRGMHSLTFGPTGQTLLCGGRYGVLKVWDLKRDEPPRVLQGRQAGHIDALALDPAGRTLVTAAGERTLMLWDLASGRHIRRLEGHIGPVMCVGVSPNGSVMGSKGGALDDSVRLWNPHNGVCLAVIPEPGSNDWPPGLAFHPHLPLLATVGSEQGARGVRANCVIHIWQLDPVVLLAQPTASTVTYTSAKVVLVGESNVGKSYLAHRIATGALPEEGSIKSTHGMRFWPLKPEQLSPTAKPPAGQRRDVVLWDMGGQNEYRLIHQLFLQDTTVALILLDPTRGSEAFKEVEAWNKYLDRQLGGRAATKLLVGSKVDEPSDTIDHQSVARLCSECGFIAFHETSSLTGRGVGELCHAMSQAIDWDELELTSRPALFQRIRDEIEARRELGEVVVHVSDIQRALGSDPPTEEDAKAVGSVAQQLATQGLIARSRVSTGEPVLVLRIEEIERYAGSLIVAARNNPRGVPALELRAIAQPGFALPGIETKNRLPRGQERPVLECTVQLMLEHGICFQHEGLLVFPTLFGARPETPGEALPHTVSLYYDFAGAIDNIYASLIAWLVLARDFGRPRLWAGRVEFEVAEGGLCGLRKVPRPGGFAHVDVYFESSTPEERRHQFVSFVEEHLQQHGVDVRERVVVPCPRGFIFDEETLRMRIAEGAVDVLCPRCEERHSLTESAADVRKRDPQIIQHTWAVKTQVERRRERSAERAVHVLETTPETKQMGRPIRLLHLSDLHFSSSTPVAVRLQWLRDDIKQGCGLGFEEVDYLVVSGDVADKACAEGYEKAYEFVSGLTLEFGLSAERCIFVPGNHDARDLREAYDWRENPGDLTSDQWVRQGSIVLARNADEYPLRFKAFSDGFFHKFLQRPYPLDHVSQGMAIPFWDTGIQFLALNSSWQIDQFNRKRAGLHPEAVANAIREAQRQESEARRAGQLTDERRLFRIAVWHHSVTAPDFKMTDSEFLGHLQNNGVRVALHGDVHEMRRDLVGYWHEDRKLHMVGSGSFGAGAADRPESTPRMYNILEVARDFTSVRIHTRHQVKADGPWDGWHEWPDPHGGSGRVPYYDINW